MIYEFIPVTQDIAAISMESQWNHKTLADRPEVSLKIKP